ncbi:hypothetical protein [uncultured Aquitalea sp.]|nr:hypothetical protein [uncultured Aquitalea sp.]
MSSTARRHHASRPAGQDKARAWAFPQALSLGFFIQPFTAVGHR